MDCPTHARQREGQDDRCGGLGGNWGVEKNMNLGEARTQDRGVEKIGFCFSAHLFPHFEPKKRFLKKVMPKIAFS